MPADPTVRGVDIANGATLHEHDIQTTATTRLGGLWRGNDVMVGAIGHGQAVVPLPHGHLLLVTSDRDSTARLIDTVTGAQRVRFAVGKDPDAAILDPAIGHVLVRTPEAGTVSEIDTAKAAVIRTIQVKPALEFAATGRRRTLFVNNEDANEIDTVDLTVGRARVPIALPGCEAPTGLAYDGKTDRRSRRVPMARQGSSMRMRVGWFRRSRSLAVPTQ